MRNRTTTATGTGTAVAVAVVVLVSGCAAVPLAPVAAPTTSPEDLDRLQYPPAADATLATCTVTSGFLQAAGAVSNPTKHPYNYTISINFLNGKALLVGEVFADPLPVLKAGAITRWTATSPTVAAGTLTCLVSSVTRATPLLK